MVPYVVLKTGRRGDPEDLRAAFACISQLVVGVGGEDASTSPEFDFTVLDEVLEDFIESQDLAGMGAAVVDRERGLIYHRG